MANEDHQYHNYDIHIIWNVVNHQDLAAQRVTIAVLFLFPAASDLCPVCIHIPAQPCLIELYFSHVFIPLLLFRMYGTTHLILMNETSCSLTSTQYFLLSNLGRREAMTVTHLFPPSDVSCGSTNTPVRRLPIYYKL